MAIRTETYALARPVPYMVQRGVKQTLACPIRYQGSLVTPDSGTVTIVDPSGAEVVSSAAVTVAGSQATYEWTPDADATEGSGWEVRWSLVFGGDQYPTYYITLYVVDYVPPPCITEEDIYTREPELRYQVPQAQGSRGDSSGWQPQLDAAYYDLLQRLLDTGREPWEIREVHGYRAWLLARSLELVCLAASSGGGGDTWMARATHYMHEGRRATAALRIQYRDDDAGTRRAGPGIVTLAPVGREPWTW